jgi:WD40 repeat protein
LDDDKLIRQGILSIPHKVIVLKHDHKVSNVVFSPDGKYIATVSRDNTSWVWNASTGKQVFNPLKHDERVTNVMFSPDGKYIATASWDNTARVWDAATGKRVFVLSHDEFSE